MRDQGAKGGSVRDQVARGVCEGPWCQGGSVRDQVARGSVRDQGWPRSLREWSGIYYGHSRGCGLIGLIVIICLLYR